MSQNGDEGQQAQIMTLEIRESKGNCPSSCARPTHRLTCEQRRLTQAGCPLPGSSQHEGSTPLPTTPRTCFLWGSPCSRKSLKQTYTQVGTRYILLTTTGNSWHHLLTGVSQVQGAGVTCAKSPSRWSAATCSSEARRRQELAYSGFKGAVLNCCLS